jgi:hypothetical protein
MLMRIFAWRVEFMAMMRMLDGRNPKTSACEFCDQFTDQCGLARVLASNDVNSSGHAAAVEAE